MKVLAAPGRVGGVHARHVHRAGFARDRVFPPDQLLQNAVDPVGDARGDDLAEPGPVIRRSDFPFKAARVEKRHRFGNHVRRHDVFDDQIAVLDKKRMIVRRQLRCSALFLRVRHKLPALPREAL